MGVCNRVLRMVFVGWALWLGGCGGEADDPLLDPPLYQVSGTWDLIDTPISGCGALLGFTVSAVTADGQTSEPVLVAVRQNGNFLHLFDPSLHSVISGTISGDVIDLHGSYYDEVLVGTIEVLRTEVVVGEDARSFSGKMWYRFTPELYPAFACQGVSAITGTKQD